MIKMTNIQFSKDLNNNFLSNLKQQLSQEFNNCNTIAIKIHFGEPGNTNSFTPDQIKPITDLLQELNIDFFLYDSSVVS